MEEKVYSVSEISRLIKHTLENNPLMNGLWIKGEISNLTYHSSGHIYFTLKDENAVISSVFFRYASRNLDFKLEEGMSILALGSLSVFEKRGSYQFIVTMVRKEGIGELLQRIEKLKKKLLDEGIFNTAHKKKLPFLPKRLGVVTSPTGAAFRDIVKVALRRHPNLEIVLSPAKVQGGDAALSIVRGIEELNRAEWEIDVIICGRGGGSFEDLMPFSEESVVRAIYNSRIPVISAVGHQIDHPLSDDAADYAAPTPSAAAEIAVPVIKDLMDEIDYLYMRSLNSILSRFKDLRTKVDGIMSLRIFRNPREIMNIKELFLADMESRIISGLKDLVSSYRNRLLMVPDIRKLIKSILVDKNGRFNLAVTTLEKISPLGVLKRGYAIVTDMQGRVIKSIRGVNPGAGIDLAFQDGSMNCTVNTIHAEVRFGKESVIEK